MYKVVPSCNQTYKVVIRLSEACQLIDNNYNDYLKSTIRLIQPYYSLDDCHTCCVRSRGVYYD